MVAGVATTPFILRAGLQGARCCDLCTRFRSTVSLSSSVSMDISDWTSELIEICSESEESEESESSMRSFALRLLSATTLLDRLGIRGRLSPPRSEDEDSSCGCSRIERVAMGMSCRGRRRILIGKLSARSTPLRSGLLERRDGKRIVVPCAFEF